MPINDANTENKTKERRPPGVWVLTVFALLYVGIFDLHPTTTLNVLRGHTAMYSESTMRVTYVYVFLAIFIIIASVLAWSGLEIGRKSFLFFITLYFLGDGISNYAWGTRIPNPNDVRGWISYLSNFAFPIVCIWYFNRPSTKEFFRKVETRVSL